MHSNADFEAYANALGFKGSDTDLFYECYYDIDNEGYERECEVEEYRSTL